MDGVGFAAACRMFFGMKEGQGLLEFSKEVKELTPEDRAELKEELEKELQVSIKE